MSVNFESIGEENNIPLVMIHGAGGSSATWFLQLKTLSNHLHCVAIDLNGHGKTADRNESRTVTSYLKDIDGVCDRFTQPFLLGHSMGGALAQLYALENPEKLGGIILVGTGAKLSVHPIIFNMLENDFESYVSAVGEYMFHEGANPKMIEASKVEVRKCNPSVIARDFQMCNEFDIIARVNEITLPTLIIVGKDDMMTPVKYSEYLHQSISDSTLKILDNAGHSVMLEQSTKFNETVLEWIRNRVAI